MGELNVELVEVDVAENELPQFLLEEELANPLQGPAGEHGLRRFRNVPREHGFGNGEIEGAIRVCGETVKPEEEEEEEDNGGLRCLGVAATNHKAPYATTKLRNE